MGTGQKRRRSDRLVIQINLNRIELLILTFKCLKKVENIDSKNFRYDYIPLLCV